MGRRVLAAGLLVVLAGCGGGGAGAGSGSPTPSGPSSGAGPVQVQVHARGCHTTRGGQVDIQMSFDLPGRAPLAGYQGTLDYHATLVQPRSWSVAPGSPHLIDRPNNDIFHLVVPAGEPIPGTLELDVRAVAVDATEQLVAGTVQDLSGATVDTPFGTTSVEEVRASGGVVAITVTAPSQGLGSGVTSLGPGTARVDVSGRSVDGTITQTPDGPASLRFDLGAAPTGEATLILGAWTFDLQPDAVLPVPVGVCTAG